MSSLNVLLPVGISFYTFQTLGYSIDVRRGKIKAEKSLLSYALFVTFFPQLVAGPIERTENLLPQLKRVPAFDYGKAVSGLRLALWGMVKKVIFADTLAIFVDKAYSNTATAPGITMLAATVFFAFQMLCDFSGYTDIARGCARILGYDLMNNFDAPYLSHSVTEFWRRWHISLSSWLRDYVYIPLGGSRCGKARTYINLMATFLVSGLWHGAGLHFVLWGALHGVCLCAERMAGVNKRKVSLRYATCQPSLSPQHRAVGAMQVCVTFAIVCLLWVFFRADNVTQAMAVLQKIAAAPRDILTIIHAAGKVSFGTGFWGSYILGLKGTFISSVMCVFCVSVSQIGMAYGHMSKSLKTPILRYALYYVGALMVFMSMLESAGRVEFIYFQF